MSHIITHTTKGSKYLDSFIRSTFFFSQNTIFFSFKTYFYIAGEPEILDANEVVLGKRYVKFRSGPREEVEFPSGNKVCVKFRTAIK